jgi:EAL domain-containing protein (putative c-di-GMP-specific phosphodiesterase class I)
MSPIDVLKIDLSFVHQIPNDADDPTIVSAIINTARGLKRLVVAEGVVSESTQNGRNTSDPIPAEPLRTQGNP